MAFEVCRSGKAWTAVVVCDVCGEDIEDGGNLYWSWEEEKDDKKYQFALPIVAHLKCSKEGGFVMRPSGSKVIKMELMEYVSLLLLKYPLGPAMSYGNPIHENES